MAAKIVAKLLNFEQKQRRITQKISTTFNDNPNMLKKVITNDKQRVYGYDIDIRRSQDRKILNL